MQVYNQIDFRDKIVNPVVTIGSFDGVHMAHRIILRRIINLAREINGKSVILTFDPHPREVLSPESKFELLNTRDEKIKLLKEIGIDVVIFIPFTIEFSKISSDDFIRNILVEKLNCKKIVIGYNHYFGHNREGNFEILYRLGKELGFTVEEIPEQDIQNESISSSKIRKALDAGDMMKANAYLNYEYNIHGKLREGEKIFSQFGYRSWMLEIDSTKKLIPAIGLYFAKVHSFNKEWHAAVMVDENKSIHLLLVGDDSVLKDKEAELTFKYLVRRCPDDADCKDLKKMVDAIIIQAGYYDK